MKIFTLLGSTLLCSSLSCFASDVAFVAADSNITTKICIAAATDNTQQMVGNLKALSRRGTALSYRSFVNTIRCNDQYIGNFANAYQAQKSVAYLDKYTNQFNKKRQGTSSIEDIAKLQNQPLVVLVRSH